MNEADTRYHLIDPVLRDNGYVSREHITLETVLTPPPVESSGPKGRRRNEPLSAMEDAHLWQSLVIATRRSIRRVRRSVSGLCPAPMQRSRPVAQKFHIRARGGCPPASHAVELFLKGAILRKAPDERFSHGLEHLQNRYKASVYVGYARRGSRFAPRQARSA